MGKEFRYVGKPTPRIDGKAIVTGSAEYANDIHMHGMLYGRMKMHLTGLPECLHRSGFWTAMYVLSVTR